MTPPRSKSFIKVAIWPIQNCITAAKSSKDRAEEGAMSTGDRKDSEVEIPGHHL